MNFIGLAETKLLQFRYLEYRLIISVTLLVFNCRIFHLGKIVNNIFWSPINVLINFGDQIRTGHSNVNLVI